MRLNRAWLLLGVILSVNVPISSADPWVIDLYRIGFDELAGATPLTITTNFEAALSSDIVAYCGVLSGHYSTSIHPDNLDSGAWPVSLRAQVDNFDPDATLGWTWRSQPSP